MYYFFYNQKKKFENVIQTVLAQSSMLTLLAHKPPTKNLPKANPHEGQNSRGGREINVFTSFLVQALKAKFRALPPWIR